MSKNFNKVKEARLSAGMKGVELAKALGVSSAYLSQVENGARPTSDELLARVLEITGQALNNLSAEDVAQTPDKLKHLEDEMRVIREQLDDIKTLLLKLLAKN